MDLIQAATTQLTKDHDVVVGDSAGEDGKASQTITLLSDLAIIPLQPSRPDIRALNNGLKAIRLAQQITGGKRPEAILVLNVVSKRDVQARKLKEQLTTFKVTVAHSEIRRLNAFRDSCDKSVTRMAGDEGKEATRDLDALFNEVVMPRLNKIEAKSANNWHGVGNG